MTSVTTSTLGMFQSDVDAAIAAIQAPPASGGGVSGAGNGGGVVGAGGGAGGGAVDPGAGAPPPPAPIDAAHMLNDIASVIASLTTGDQAAHATALAQLGADVHSLTGSTSAIGNMDDFTHAMQDVGLGTGSVMYDVTHIDQSQGGLMDAFHQDLGHLWG